MPGRWLNMVKLRVTEIFYSLQGEALSSGWPTVFIRLTGCPLRCSWCDTEYAFTGGEALELDTILQRVAGFGARHVTVTGGEPLAQADCGDLLTALCNASYKVSLETSGALDIANLDPRVTVVMDLKAPGSGEDGRNRYANLDLLRPTDQIKFVLADRADYDWARARLLELRLDERCEVLVQPVFGSLPPAELAQWVLDDHLPVRFQLQLHKLLWGDARGR